MQPQRRTEDELDARNLHAEFPPVPVEIFDDVCAGGLALIREKLAHHNG